MGTLVPSCKGWKRLTAAVCAGLMAGAFSFLPMAEARGGELLPQGGVSSTASIVTDSGTMNITGAANNVIKWVSFSIGQDNAVKFDNNDYLNYVTGHARSDIMGTLTGGGNIYLVNPNGILIGDGARIDVGSLYLSTKNLTTDNLKDFASATSALTTAAINGDVINMGKLNADVITVEGNNITFKNVADVKDAAGTAINNNVTLTASDTGEIHIGSAGGTASGYTVENGTEIDYKLVSTADELQAINENSSGSYMLANDITLPNVGEGESNFTPINDFTGRFDGLGYAVNNLTINKANDYWVGLFGSAISNSVIENVTLSGGSLKGYANVGIVGRNEGTVRRVYNDGLAISGQSSVGGIVGENNGKVTQVWNTGTVTGTMMVGGIVGDNSGDDATVEIAYNAGNVNGVKGSYMVDQIGGIVGHNISGTIQNVYNTGNMTADGGSQTAVGGIAGFSDNINLVSYAYNTVIVTGNIGSYVVMGTVPNDTNAFADWNIDRDGTNDAAVWRIYEGQKAPLLKAFMKDKDEVVSSVVYDGVKNVDDSTDVGAYTVASTKNSTGITQTGNNAINWHSLSIITPKTLTTVENVDKTYDGNATATLTADNLAEVYAADKEKLSVTTTSATYNDKNAGDKTVTYKGLMLSGDKAKNYIIAADGTTTGTISKANLEISVEDYTREYNGGTDASGATLTVVDGEIFAGDSMTGGTKEFTTKTAGTGKTITVSDVTISDGNNGGNYNVTYAANTNSTINRKAISLVADPMSITQGEEIPESFTGNLTGFVAGEGLAEGDGYAFALEGTPEAVGSYAVNGTLNGEASGNYGDNYTFANAASNATAFTINAKPAPSNPGSGSGGSVTPATPVNPVEPAPINPAEPIPANPAGPTPAIPSEPTPATPGTPGQAVTNPASGTLRPEGTLAERVIAEVEAGNLSLGTVTELENAAETAKEQPFAKDMAAVAEMGAVEATAPSPAPSDSGHSYTMLDGGLVAMRDDVNSAPASAVMGNNPGRRNANEVMAAAEQVDLTIGTEEVHNRQENSTVDEDSDEEDKKQSEQN